MLYISFNNFSHAGTSSCLPGFNKQRIKGLAQGHQTVPLVGLKLVTIRIYGSRKVFQRGSNFDGCFFFGFFLVEEWIQIPLISGHHRPASETPLKWRFAGVPMMALLNFA